VGAALAVVVAAASYRFFEEPILRYKNRLGRLPGEGG
jgi:peptidoglycan/LPS O-acetylase OafA/YrhL